MASCSTTTVRSPSEDAPTAAASPAGPAPTAPRGGVIKAGRDPVAGEKVTQLLEPRRPPLADHLHRLEAAAAPAVPLLQELGDRAVKLLGRGLHRMCHPVVDLADGDRVED